MNVVETEIVSFPTHIKAPPNPLISVALAAFDQSNDIASFAATQKLSPVIAIRIYAYLVKNWINLSKQ